MFLYDNLYRILLFLCFLVGLGIYEYFWGSTIKRQLVISRIKRFQKIRKSKILILVDDDFQYQNNHIISIDDSPKILNILRKCNKKNRKLELIIHSTGGTICESDVVVNGILEHNLNITCYIPRFANSAATVLALSTNKIYVDKYAYISPTDPQITINVSEIETEDERTYSSKTLMDYIGYTNKHETDIDVKLYLEALEAKQLHDDNINIVKKILDRRSKQTKNIISRLCSGIFPHHAPIYYTEMKELGLHVDIGIPKEIDFIFTMFEKYFL